MSHLSRDCRTYNQFRITRLNMGQDDIFQYRVLDRIASFQELPLSSYIASQLYWKWFLFIYIALSIPTAATSSLILLTVMLVHWFWILLLAELIISNQRPLVPSEISVIFVFERF